MAVAAAAALLLLVMPAAATPVASKDDDAGLALAMAIFRTGICTAIVATREGVATAGTGATPGLKVLHGQEARFTAIGRACSSAAAED
jgi:hypothetical protein